MPKHVISVIGLKPLAIALELLLVMTSPSVRDIRVD